MAQSLLPNGFEDKLSDAASIEGRAVESLARAFEDYGYDRVKPPLIEFEDTMTSGLGESSASQVFRLPDPITNRMLAVRADMTVQVARIAQTRLAHNPSPQRLCYHGQVLRTHGEELRPERQFSQVGLELIGINATGTGINSTGSDALLQADLEVLAIARAALKRLGIEQFQIDLTLPDLVEAIVTDEGLPRTTIPALAKALDARDIAALRSVCKDGDLSARLANLFALPVSVDQALSTCRAQLPGAACQRELGLAENFVAQANALLGEGVRLTFDPTEGRGSAYHDGIGYNLYAQTDKHRAVQIGRGGRYRLDDARATGLSIYMDGVQDLLMVEAAGQVRKKVAVGLSADVDDIARLVAEGASVLLVDRAPKQAAAQGATHILTANGTIEEIV